MNPKRARKQSNQPISNRKTGRTADEIVNNTAPSLATKRKRRPGPHGDDNVGEGASSSSKRQKSKSASSRGTTATTTTTTQEAVKTTIGDQVKGQRRKRGRPSLQPKVQTGEVAKEAVTANSKKGRKRASLQELATYNAQNQRTDAGRGEEEDTVGKTRTSGVAPGKTKPCPKQKRGPLALSSPHIVPTPERREPDQSSALQPKKRSRRSSTLVEDDTGPPSPAKPYLHVAPQIQRIRSSTIVSKWAPLGPSSMDTTSSILQNALQPILQLMSNTTQRNEHATTALKLVASRIHRKIGRGLPFPPCSRGASAAEQIKGNTTSTGTGTSISTIMLDRGRTAELDFEKVLDGRAALESRLEPALHAVELLRREKAVAERQLESDYETLRGLEKSARAQGREQGALLKKAHVLAHDEQRSDSRNEGSQVVIKPEFDSGSAFKVSSFPCFPRYQHLITKEVPNNSVQMVELIGVLTSVYFVHIGYRRSRA